MEGGSVDFHVRNKERCLTVELGQILDLTKSRGRSLWWRNARKWIMGQCNYAEGRTLCLTLRPA